MTRDSARRMRAVAGKEFLHVRRDPWSLALAVVIPMLMLVLFGYALTLDVDRVPLAVWDQSRTPRSRELIDAFAGSRYFTVVQYVDRYDALERAIDRRDALAGLVVGREYAGQIASGRRAAVQMIFDGSDSNTATLAMGYAAAVSGGLSQRLMVQEVERAGGRAPAPPLDLRPRVWFNADMESRNAIVPGLIAISMMIIAALLTSMTVAREWERGTMEQLVSTPIQAHELVLGKLAPYFAIGMLDMVLVALTGKYLLHVPLRGSVVLLMTMAAVFLIGVLGMGLLISIVTRSQLVSNQIAMLTTFLPAFLLSGFIYPIANMPAAIRAMTYLIPARYFVELLRGIYLKGVGLEVLWPQALVLCVFSAAAVALARNKFRKKLE